MADASDNMEAGQQPGTAEDPGGAETNAGVQLQLQMAAPLDIEPIDDAPTPAASGAAEGATPLLTSEASGGEQAPTRVSEPAPTRVQQGAPTVTPTSSPQVEARIGGTRLQLVRYALVKRFALNSHDVINTGGTVMRGGIEYRLPHGVNENNLLFVGDDRSIFKSGGLEALRGLRIPVGNRVEEVIAKINLVDDIGVAGPEISRELIAIVKHIARLDPSMEPALNSYIGNTASELFHPEGSTQDIIQLLTLSLSGQELGPEHFGSVRDIVQLCMRMSQIRCAAVAPLVPTFQAGDDWRNSAATRQTRAGWELYDVGAAAPAAVNGGHSSSLGDIARIFASTQQAGTITVRDLEHFNGKMDGGGLDAESFGTLLKMTDGQQSLLTARLVRAVVRDLKGSRPKITEAIIMALLRGKTTANALFVICNIKGKTEFSYEALMTGIMALEVIEQVTKFGFYTDVRRFADVLLGKLSKIATATKQPIDWPAVFDLVLKNFEVADLDRICDLLRCGTHVPDHSGSHIADELDTHAAAELGAAAMEKRVKARGGDTVIVDKSKKRKQSGQPEGDRVVCRTFSRTGSCSYGATCKFLHPTPDGAATAGESKGGNPNATTNCFDFINGNCKRAACNYRHSK
jgi:hypothetical protein